MYIIMNLMTNQYMYKLNSFLNNYHMCMTSILNFLLCKVTITFEGIHYSNRLYFYDMHSCSVYLLASLN